MSKLFHARKSDSTERGSRYTILQDGPASFHITVQRGDVAIYDYIANPRDMQEIETLIVALEEEII